MLYSFQHNFLYTHVPRTGGVSLTQALQMAAPGMRSIGDQHAALSEARADLGAEFDRVFKFAVVRNSWDRLVSYRGFLATVTAPPDTPPDLIADPDAAHWREFEGFLDELLAERCIVDGVERRRFNQFHQLADAEGHLLCDRVGRFETLATDVADIFDCAGLRLPPLRHENRSNRHGYAAYYTPAARQMVAEALSDEIAAFRFEFDGGAPG